MSAPDFRTEKPYVVATRSDCRKSHHYLQKSATDAIKAESSGFRRLYGRHRGHWVELATYQDGKLLKE